MIYCQLDLKACKRAGAILVSFSLPLADLLNVFAHVKMNLNVLAIDYQTVSIHRCPGSGKARPVGEPSMLAGPADDRA